MKTEHLTNTLVSAATRAKALAGTLAFGPASPALADRIRLMSQNSRRASRQFLDRPKLAGASSAAVTGEPSPLSS
jgi:hypothetical protein